jgi:hypothetical protein
VAVIGEPALPRFAKTNPNPGSPQPNRRYACFPYSAGCSTIFG